MWACFNKEGLHCIAQCCISPSWQVTDSGLGTRRLLWNVANSADLMVCTDCVQDLHKTNFTARNKKVINTITAETDIDVSKKTDSFYLLA